MSFLENFKNRNSTREFIKNKQIPQEQKEIINQVINSAPTSNNFFASSVIAIENPETLATLGEILGQKQVADCSIFYLFLADSNRIDYVLKANGKAINNKDLSSLLLATGDSFIQATMAQDIALEFDLSSCFIGGVRSFVSEINLLLNIQGTAFPAIGLAIGYPIKVVKGMKPKLNRIYKEKYFKEQLEKEILKYEPILEKYWSDKGIEGDYINSSNKYLAKEHSKANEEISTIWELKK